MISSAEEFGSLLQARTYIDAVHGRINSLAGRELMDALDGIDRARQEFPELALERSQPSCSPVLTMLADKITRSDSRASPPEAFRLLSRFREISWDDLEPVVRALHQQGRVDVVLEIISVVLDRVTFGDGTSMAGLGEVLEGLLADEHPPAIERVRLAELVRSARGRLNHPPSGRQEPGSVEPVLATAERVRAAPPPMPPKPQPHPVWPSGRLSFDEFLLQWPCEIELPTNLDDASFIDEAFRAILLRGPEAAERNQYLNLLRDGAVSEDWAIEDLLASEELHSLERHLRVVYGNGVVTEPGTSGQKEMPAVTWPARSDG